SSAARKALRLQQGEHIAGMLEPGCSSGPLREDHMAESLCWLSGMLTVALLLLTGCGTLEVSIAGPEPTVATSFRGGTEPFTTCTPSSLGTSPGPVATLTPPRWPSLESTPAPAPTLAPCLTAPPSSTIGPSRSRLPRAFSFAAEPVETEQGYGIGLTW
ncbi:MAG: hypothetical protein PVH41_13150, partial [Anaerolineae bacterium]